MRKLADIYQIRSTKIIFEKLKVSAKLTALIRMRINAIYKNGAFHPLKPLDLKEGSIFEIGIIKDFGSVSDFTNGDENNLYDLDEEEYLNLKKIINN